MSIVTGVVEGCHTKWEKYNILVNGTWYSTKLEWANCQPAEGDTVNFDDGGKNFMKNCAIITSGGNAPASAAPKAAPAKAYSAPTAGFPMGANDKSRAINRQNALTNAVNYAKDASPETIISFARYFESYTTGTLDGMDNQAYVPDEDISF